MMGYHEMIALNNKKQKEYDREHQIGKTAYDKARQRIHDEVSGLVRLANDGSLVSISWAIWRAFDLGSEFKELEVEHEKEKLSRT